MVERVSQSNYGVIDINSTASPAILQRFLGVSSVNSIYQYRQQGKLPADVNASYVQCLTHFIKYLTNKNGPLTVESPAGNLLAKKTNAEIKLTVLKSERLALDISKDRGELVDLNEVVENLLPFLSLINSSITRIGRNHPETMEDVKTVQKSIYEFANKLALQADKEQINFENELLNPKELEELESSFLEVEDF